MTGSGYDAAALAGIASGPRELRAVSAADAVAALEAKLVSCRAEMARPAWTTRSRVEHTPQRRLACDHAA